MDVRTNLYKTVDALLATKKRVVVAIDGKAAAGKTRLAADLFDRYFASVIHTDDFYLPRTAEHFQDGAPRRKYAPPLDSVRFKKQVLEPLAAGEAFSYDVFSGIRQAVIAKNHIKDSGLIIVEGAYSLLPDFGPYADLTLALTLSETEQRKRLMLREGDYAETFISHWLPPEQRYQEETNLFSRADRVLELKADDETVIYLARHGKTDSNRNKIIQGQLDVPLSEEGRKEALCLADRTAHLALDELVSSDLSRALETAHIIQNRLPGLDVQSDKAWREIALGLMQGKTYDHCFTHFFAEMKTMKDSPETFRAPGGETGEAILTRIKAALQHLIESKTNSRMMVISHGFVLNLLITALKRELKISEVTAIAHNTAVTKLIFRNKQISDIAYINDTRHLEQY